MHARTHTTVVPWTGAYIAHDVIQMRRVTENTIVTHAVASRETCAYRCKSDRHTRVYVARLRLPLSRKPRAFVERGFA